MEIVEARATDALEALKEEWDRLVQACGRATIYQTWEWNAAWWHAFRAGKRLRLLVVRHEGQLVGLAPFYVSRHLGTPLRRLAFLGTGASDYLDVIARDDVEEEVCRAVLDHLFVSRDFDLCDLQQLSPHSLLSRVGEANRPARDPRHMAFVQQEPCPYVPLPAAWEEYTARVGKKMRSNISYYDRLLPRTFEDAKTYISGTEELEEAMDALFDLHQKRWNARLLPGVLGGSKVQAFHREIARRFQERGWLRLHVTRAQGRIVAALYCFLFRRHYYYYLGGFAPDLAKYSLGTVLTSHAMRNGIAEGCDEFDFLRGNEPYKYRWQPDERFNRRLLIGRPRSLRSRAMVRLNRLEQAVEHRAKEFAERRGRGKAK